VVSRLELLDVASASNGALTPTVGLGLGGGRKGYV